MVRNVERVGECRVWTQHSYGVAKNSDRCSDQQLPTNTFRLKIHREQEWGSFVSAFKSGHTVCDAKELNAKKEI